MWQAGPHSYYLSSQGAIPTTKRVVSFAVCNLSHKELLHPLSWQNSGLSCNYCHAATWCHLISADFKTVLIIPAKAILPTSHKHWPTYSAGAESSVQAP